MIPPRSDLLLVVELLIHPVAQYRKDVFEPEVSRSALVVSMRSADMGFETRRPEGLAGKVAQFGAASERQRERRPEPSAKVVYEGDLSKSRLALSRGSDTQRRRLATPNRGY